MSYTPKSKILFKSTSGGELMDKLTRKPYGGDYMEFSNGRLYAGKNSSNLDIELIPLVKNTNNRMGNTYDSRRYSNLKPPTKKSLSKYKQVPSSKSPPTEEDYKRGYFTRYFAKRVNQQFGLFEIEAKTFESLISPKPIFDPNLYKVGTLIWSLKGNTHKSNSQQLIKSERNTPFLSLLFHNPSEYKR